MSGDEEYEVGCFASKFGLSSRKSASWLQSTVATARRWNEKPKRSRLVDDQAGNGTLRGPSFRGQAVDPRNVRQSTARRARATSGGRGPTKIGSLVPAISTEGNRPPWLNLFSAGRFRRRINVSRQAMASQAALTVQPGRPFISRAGTFRECTINVRHPVYGRMDVSSDAGVVAKLGTPTAKSARLFAGRHGSFVNLRVRLPARGQRLGPGPIVVAFGRGVVSDRFSLHARPRRSVQRELITDRLVPVDEPESTFIGPR